MSHGRVRNLSPEFIKDILPKLPPAADPNVLFDRQNATDGMARMKAGEDHALATVWLQLLEHVEVQNVKVKMRDGWEEEMRIYTPTPKSQDASSGEEGKKYKRGMPVVYSLHGGGFIAGS